jgi:hypothetical protein
MATTATMSVASALAPVKTRAQTSPAEVLLSGLSGTVITEPL